MYNLESGKKFREPRYLNMQAPPKDCLYLRLFPPGSEDYNDLVMNCETRSLSISTPLAVQLGAALHHKEAHRFLELINEMKHAAWTSQDLNIRIQIERSPMVYLDKVQRLNELRMALLAAACGEEMKKTVAMLEYALQWFRDKDMPLSFFPEKQRYAIPFFAQK